jgi:hypothetical protein
MKTAAHLPIVQLSQKVAHEDFNQVDNAVFNTSSSKTSITQTLTQCCVLKHLTRCKGIMNP